MNAPINGEEGPPTAAAAASQAANHAAPPAILETPRRDANRVTSPLPVDASPRWKHDIEEQLVTVSNPRKREGLRSSYIRIQSYFSELTSLRLWTLPCIRRRGVSSACSIPLLPVARPTAPSLRRSRLARPRPSLRAAADPCASTMQLAATTAATEKIRTTRVRLRLRLLNSCAARRWLLQ